MDKQTGTHVAVKRIYQTVICATRTCARTRTRMHTRAHACTHARTCTQACKRAQVHACAHERSASTHPHAHTCMLAHAQVHPSTILNEARYLQILGGAHMLICVSTSMSMCVLALRACVAICVRALLLACVCCVALHCVALRVLCADEIVSPCPDCPGESHVPHAPHALASKNKCRHVQRAAAPQR